MRKLIFFIVFFLFFLFLTFPYFAQDRYASCDLCGYCPPNNPPSNWEKCAECLYPEAPKNPNLKETLKINPNDNLAPTPYPGRKYTMLGCIKISGGFEKEGAVVGVIQFFLNIIFSIVGGVAFLSLIYGSFLIITSQENPEKLNYGKRVVYGAIVGLIFSLSSVFLIRFLASGVLRIPGF